MGERSVQVGGVLATLLCGIASGQSAVEGSSGGSPDPAADNGSASDRFLDTIDDLDDAWVPGEGLPTWRLRFEPGVAYFSVSGDLEFPGGAVAGSTFDLEEVNLDSPRATFTGELHLAKGKNRITFEGTGFSSSSRESIALNDARLGPTPISAGERVSFSFEYQTFALLGSHRVISRASGVRGDGPPDAAFGVDLIAGLRFHRVDANASTVAGGAANASADELFVEPVFGAGVELTISDAFRIEGRAEGGGFAFGDQQSISGNLVVSFEWSPTPHIGLQTGYRLMVLSLESGDDPDRFEWDGAMAGLFWGVSIAF